MGFCIDDLGYMGAEATRFAGAVKAAGIRAGEAIRQFELNAKDAVSNYTKLAAVSSRGIAVEEEQHEHLKNTYWPRETQFLNEFTQAQPWETEDVLSKRYAGRMWAPVAGAFARRIKEMEAAKPRYHGTSYIRGMQEILVIRGQTRANMISLANRIAYAEIQAIRDTDFDRRKAAIAMRQGLIGEAASLMKSAAGGLAAAGGEAAANATNALKALGNSIEQGSQAFSAYSKSPESRKTDSAESQRIEGILNKDYSLGDPSAGNSVNGQIPTEDGSRSVSVEPASVTNSQQSYNSDYSFGDLNGIDIDLSNTYSASDGVTGTSAGDGTV